jgi:DNA-directed RNA polymerase specialized sigma24 family protein
MDFPAEDSSSFTESDKNEKKLFAGSNEVKEELIRCIKTAPNLLKRLSYFALKHIRLYFFSSTINGESAVEVVQQIIEKVLSLERKWYREKQPDFVNFLRLAIFSYIRNKYKNKEKIVFVRMYDDEGREIEEYDKDYVRNCIHSDLNDVNLQASYLEFIERLKHFLRRDNTALLILECELNGTNKHIEIAEILKIDIKEVRKGVKRLRRGILRFLRRED